MKPKKDIEQFVANIDLETQDERDRHVLDTVLRAHEDRQQQRHPPTWRIIMKSNTTKLATAATIFLALGLSVTILDRMATPAWALDQTVEVGLTGGTNDHDVIGTVPGGHAHTAQVVLETP